jgi:uncharacterized protein YndB with AHSA1/START domain
MAAMAAMAERGSHLLVRFSSPSEFAAELRARGPNVEPVVRLTYRWAAGAGGLPVRHLSVVAGYVRRLAGGTVVVQELVHHAGDVWPGIATAGSERARARAEEAHEVVARTARELGLEVSAGTYALAEAVA